MRRTAHKLTGNAHWLKAEDFGPMADAILRKSAEPTQGSKKPLKYAKAPEDHADEAVSHATNQNWFERFYTPIRTQIVTGTAPLDVILSKLPYYDKDNQTRSSVKLAQATRYSQIISDAMHRGYLAVNKNGLVEAIHSAEHSPEKLIKRIRELPDDMGNKFAEAMVTLAQAGHNLRGAEMKAIMDDTQRKISLGQTYLDKIK